MAVLIVFIGILYLAYRYGQEKSFDNCNAHDVDYDRMSRDQAFTSQAEMKRLYKSGYYNKK